MSETEDKIDEVPEENVIKASITTEQAKKLKNFINTEEKPEEDKAEDTLPKTMPDAYRDKTYDPIHMTDYGDASSLAGITGGIESSAEDKEAYLRAVLNDEPVVLNIELLGGKCLVQIRSKNTWEQALTYEAALEDQDKKIVSDYYQAMIQMQKYGAVLQIQKINNKVFSTTEFNKPKGDWKPQRDELRELMSEQIETMNNARMTLLLNALRIFEYKLSEMTAFCNDGDFWEPAD